LRDQVETDVGGDGEHLGSVPVPVTLRKLGPEALEPADLARAGTDQGDDPPPIGRVFDLDVPADAVGAQVLQNALGRGALEVEPELARLQPQDAHVRLDVTLAVEERRIAAPFRRQRLDVVGELALKVLGGIRSPDDQRGARTRQESGFLPQSPVLPIQLDWGGRDLGHGSIVGRGLPWAFRGAFFPAQS
jgi:hypothetical protein